MPPPADISDFPDGIALRNSPQLMARNCQWQTLPNWVEGLVNNVPMTRPYERAIARVAKLADGGPADSAWRVTLGGGEAS
jgi:hypothetical protein